MPEKFYLRESIRIYIDLLSTAHSTLRENSALDINNSNRIVEKYLSKCTSDFSCVKLIKYKNHGVEEEIELVSSINLLSEMNRENQAPIHFKYYGGMPGEHQERRINDEPVLRKE